MERINLNVPSQVRKRLQAVARQHGRSEAEVARSLLLEALDRAEREDFYRRVGEAQTSELSARQVALAVALERIGG